MAHTVLFVDDELDILEGIRQVLRKEPYKIATAGSADEALAVLDRMEVDVVVADQDMPGMRGTELLAEVRRRHPDTSRFMLTGHSTFDVAIRAINEGAVSGLFTKPCNAIELAAALRQAIQQRSLTLHAKRLLKVSRRQSRLLEDVEKEHPGITRVERDECGAVILDCPDDTDELLREMTRHLTEAEEKLGA